eukprot:320778-Pyramimonas_sp.AAC.1
MNNGTRYIRGEIDHLVTIYNKLNLQDFPIDMQNLTIAVESKLSSTMAKWSPIQRPQGPDLATVRTETMYLDDFSSCSDKHDRVFIAGIVTRTQEDAFGNAYSFPEVVVKIPIKRKSRFYLINVVSVMFVITTLCLIAFSVHPGDIPTRTSIDLTLFLTAV